MKIRCPSSSRLGFALSAASSLVLSLKLWSLMITGCGRTPRRPRLQWARSIFIRFLVPGSVPMSRAVGSQDSKNYELVSLRALFQIENANIVTSAPVLHIIHAICQFLHFMLCYNESHLKPEHCIIHIRHSDVVPSR